MRKTHNRLQVLAALFAASAVFLAGAAGQSYLAQVGASSASSAASSSSSPAPLITPINPPGGSNSSEVQLEPGGLTREAVIQAIQANGGHDVCFEPGTTKWEGNMTVCTSQGWMLYRAQDYGIQTPTIGLPNTQGGTGPNGGMNPQQPWMPQQPNGGMNPQQPWMPQQPNGGMMNPSQTWNGQNMQQGGWNGMQQGSWQPMQQSPMPGPMNGPNSMPQQGGMQQGPMMQVQNGPNGMGSNGPQPGQGGQMGPGNQQGPEFMINGLPPIHLMSEKMFTQALNTQIPQEGWTFVQGILEEQISAMEDKIDLLDSKLEKATTDTKKKLYDKQIKRVQKQLDHAEKLLSILEDRLGETDTSSDTGL